MGGSTNDKEQQNQAAQTQIHQNTGEAQSNLLAWLASHPSVLAQMPGSVAPPQQFSGQVGGGQTPNPLHAALGQRMPLGTPGMAPGATPPGAPQPAAYQGGQPPGLLGLLGQPGQTGQAPAVAPPGAQPPLPRGINPGTGGPSRRMA